MRMTGYEIRIDWKIWQLGSGIVVDEKSEQNDDDAAADDDYCAGNAGAHDVDDDEVWLKRREKMTKTRRWVTQNLF